MFKVIGLTAIVFAAFVDDADTGFISRVENTEWLNSEGKPVRDPASGKPIHRIERDVDGNVEILRLSGMKLSDDEFAAIGRLPKLRQLDLHQTNVTNANLQQIRDLPGLQSLNLNSTEISDPAMENIMELESLRSLCLGNVKVSPQAVAQLKEHILRRHGRRLSLGYFQRKEAQTNGDFNEPDERKVPDALIPVRVSAAIKPGDPTEASEIPLEVTIHNGLKGEIRLSTFALEPNDWNGETVSLSLVDVYRNDEPGGLFRASPAINAPLTISGMTSHRVKSGKTLTMRTDARKWDIVGGWKPGQYRVTVRVKNLDVDGGRCLLSVQSDPVVFEVK